MAFLGIDGQDALTLAILGTAAGFLALRAYRAATRKQHGTSCGACLTNQGCPADDDCGTGRGYAVFRNQTATSNPPLPERDRR